MCLFQERNGHLDSSFVSKASGLHDIPLFYHHSSFYTVYVLVYRLTWFYYCLITSVFRSESVCFIHWFSLYWTFIPWWVEGQSFKVTFVSMCMCVCEIHLVQNDGCFPVCVLYINNT